MSTMRLQRALAPEIGYLLDVRYFVRIVDQEQGLAVYGEVAGV